MRLLGLLVVCLSCLSLAARAQERIALVVGNGAYASVSSLDNPASDAQLMGATLTRLGFDVTLLVDASQVEMKRAIAQFGRALRGAGADATGLFYYAGHGVQSFGANYLLPVDVALNDAADLDLAGVDAQTVLRQMYSAANRTNIFILDACRNNPFVDIPDFDDPGLAEMQAPRGTFLAYATAPGAVAYDGDSGNSPFTRAMVDQMNRPGLSVERMFREVRISVLEQTGGRQTPWDASSLTSEFIFNGGSGVDAMAEVGAVTAWEAAQASGDVVDLILFLRSYPNSPFADEAQALLTERMRDRAPGAREGPDGQPVAKVVEPEGTAGPTDGSPAGLTATESAGLTAEEQMFAAARADGSVAAFLAYLGRYPTGRFAEMARQEAARLGDAAGAEPRVIAFGDPLVSDVSQLSGRSISQVIRGSPVYPPIAGLPEAVWQNKSCSNCHQWTEAALCEQASRYLVAQAERSLDKPHPFGGAFKQALRDWASGGCR
ncbi:MAG: peptidase C14, caspase catalytic subunit p20 [Rhodobacteraceae bacterium]|nr:peptidase C14, caspase catalytic subunit p20 [Paracoccaceae bacterium]